MGMNNDLTAEVNKIIKEAWTTRDGTAVPDPEHPDIQFGNHGVVLDVTCLYADLAESTQLATKFKNTFAAEMYKCFLNCACRIIRAKDGVITAFDGDRVMGVFIGDSKNSNASRAALAINHAVEKIINPAVLDHYFKGQAAPQYVMRHAVGIDTGKVFVARTGIRGSNDLVWVGRAANYAAKLCSLRSGNYASWVTQDVYATMSQETKFAQGGQPMWEQRPWNEMGIWVYCSSWHWGLG